MSDSRIGHKITAYCSKCKGARNSEIHGHHLESSGDEHFEWHREWYLLTCCGCDHVFAQSVSTDSQNLDYDYDHKGELVVSAIETVVMWPAKAKRERPDWFEGDTIDSDLDTPDLDASLRELYGALDHDLNVLASIGIRTSFDIASELLGVDSSKPFREKVQHLLKENLIKETEKDHINILVDAGSASAHRGWKPRISDLAALMDTLEDFIENNFVLPARNKAKAAKIAKVKAKVPPKKKAAPEQTNA